jgi:hypothetical protein
MVVVIVLYPPQSAAASEKDRMAAAFPPRCPHVARTRWMMLVLGGRMHPGGNRVAVAGTAPAG